MRRIPLSLRTEQEPRDDRPQSQPEKKPVMGWAAVAFGFLGIVMSAVFVPIGLVCSILALFMGQAIWGFFGLMLAAVGILTSPIILGLIGLSTFALVVDWKALIQPVLDMLNSAGDGHRGIDV